MGNPGVSMYYIENEEIEQQSVVAVDNSDGNVGLLQKDMILLSPILSIFYLPQPAALLLTWTSRRRTESKGGASGLFIRNSRSIESKNSSKVK